MNTKFLLTSLLIGLFFSLLPAAALAQDERIEIVVEDKNENFSVVPTGDNGMILMSSEKNEGGKGLLWSFQKYTTDFIKIWTAQMPIPRGYSYAKRYLEGSTLHILFANLGKTKPIPFQIISLNIESGEIVSNTGEIPAHAEINEFAVTNDQAYVGSRRYPTKGTGYLRMCYVLLCPPSYCFGAMRYKYKGVLVHTDLQKGQSNPIPIEYSRAHNIESIKPSPGNERVFAVVSHQPDRKIDLLYLHEYEGNKLVKKTKIESEKGNRLISGNYNQVNENTSVILGNFAAPISQQRRGVKLSNFILGGAIQASNGIYISKYIDDRQDYIEFYKFADFKSFRPISDNWSSERAEERNKRKARKRGEVAEYSYELIIHDMVETPYEYLFIGEAYHAEYETQTYSDYVNGRHVTRTRRVFVGYRYTHALVAGFDKETGELLWDQVFPIWNILTRNLKKYVRVQEDDGIVRLTYNYAGGIYTQVVDGQEIVQVRERQKIETEFTGG